MYKTLAVIITLPFVIFAAEWQSLNGPPTGRADDMSIGWDPELSHWVIHAADQTKTHRLYRSTDDGEMWDSIYSDPRIVEPHGVVANPTDAAIVYICKWVDWGIDAIWKSTNGGESWEPKDDIHMTNKHLDCITIDPDRPDTIYVGGDAWAYGGIRLPSVFRSFDGGDIWDAMKIFPANQTDPWICDISVASDENNSIVLAATSFSSSTWGVYRCVNGGPWVRTLVFPIAAVDLANIDVAYAGTAS